ncbi:MAG: J domain-containing protein [Magnetococcales bacterium]|nr:J domain-containing protein [Magnetococcales bacterium]
MYQRITEAREILGLSEEATLSEIELRIRTLVKLWHPDHHSDDNRKQYTEMTRRILESASLIRSFCANYRYSFRAEEVRKYLSPEEWWQDRFGCEPVWNSNEKNVELHKTDRSQPPSVRMKS